MRSSGILMHISSLPSPGGIGSMGDEAYAFADFLQASGIRIWQVLPIGPTGYGESPYQSSSVFAGNPLLISCRRLREEGLLQYEDAEECVNDTWFKAWNSMPTHRPALLAPYLAKLTRWLSLTRLRERNALRRGGGERALVLDELAEVVSDGTDLEKRLELKELGEALRDFLNTLDETEAQVFLARCWYMAGVKEIAEKFGFTPGKVSTMLHRPRGKLQDYLREEGLC